MILVMRTMWHPCAVLAAPSRSRLVQKSFHSRGSAGVGHHQPGHLLPHSQQLTSLCPIDLIAVA